MCYYKDTINRKNIVCICGRKNMGKTTLIERLIHEFTDMGYRVAAIKHDGHDFDTDVEGTDSYRFQRAGAYGTAVFSKERVMLIKQIRDTKEETILSFYPEADIIFIEGLKRSRYPKIEIVRRGVSKETPLLSSNKEGRFLVVTDFEEGRKEFIGEKVVQISDIEGILEEIKKKILLK